MPRKSRNIIETNFMHIIVQGINKSYIFKEDYFKKLYLELIKKDLIDYNINILAYCIMGNHAHILMYSNKTEELSKLMHRINTSYAKRFNRKNNRVGFAFRDRFYMQPIKSKSQLFNCLVYIHKNPIKANLVLNYEDYDFSSYNEFLGEKYLINDKSIELLFGTTNNYMETFENLHTKKITEEILEVYDYKDKNSVINNFFKEYDGDIEDLKNDRDGFRRLLKQLRNESGLTLRDLQETFGVGKDKINKIIKE